MSQPFLWSSPAGFALVRRIVDPTPIPYIPHDYQLEGVCKSLDGINLFAITPTGSGKTSYYIIYITVVLAVVNDPSLCPSANFPDNPLLLVICPTIPLQIEMAAQQADNMVAMGLDALAINSETRSQAHTRGEEDLWILARSKPNVILTGPEQLKSADFEKALRDDEFYNRICGTGFDEVHLLNSWGVSFRKEFGQMGFVKARMDDQHNPWILTSATIIFRDLVSPISGDSFPEFEWVLDEDRPTIIYPKTISLGSRIYAYLLRRSKATNSNLANRIRMYNSLNFDSYNAETREHLKAAPTDAKFCQIVIGTDSLSVGVSMPARLDAVLVDIDDSDDALQKLGRVGRKHVAGQHARAFIYVSAAFRSLCKKAIEKEETGISKPGEILPDISIARLTVATCKVAEINKLYNNSPTDPACTCPPCSQAVPSIHKPPCNCSGCIPDIVPEFVRPTRASKVNQEIPKAKRLSQLQRSHGTKRLLDLRLEIWRASDQSKVWMFPPLVFLPDAVITSILDNFVLLNTLPQISKFIEPHRHLTPHVNRLMEVLNELGPQFQKIAADRKAENAANRKAKKAADAEALALLEPTENPDGSGEDVAMTEGLRYTQSHFSYPALLFLNIAIQGCYRNSN
ncbi:hypothetical protein C8R43DRAFT_1163484 [Mycena crocata]|nr:hypothetical protein C8R43DRAFT_1163484 [Mycena crocata]